VARLIAAVSSAIAIGFGLLTLAGLLLGEGAGILAALTTIFLQLTVITVAVTVLIGIVNLLTVHFGRIAGRKGGCFYSLVLVLSTLAVLILALLERIGVLQARPAPTTVLLESVQVSIESALAGLVLFALVFGAYRMLRRRVTGQALLFTLVLLVLLIGALPVPGLGALTVFRDWLLAVPVSAGARGILLGIALATVVTGVRVLVGQDRSYRE
jgi:uncharacterized membrane protein (DUF485 family)